MEHSLYYFKDNPLVICLLNNSKIAYLCIIPTMYYLDMMVDLYKESHRKPFGCPIFFRYKLHLGSASGTAQDGKEDLSYHKDMYFTTFDRDNDNHGSLQCAIHVHGAWWYKNCGYSNLNGLWGEDSDKGVRWYTGTHVLHPYFTEMKVRRVRSG